MSPASVCLSARPSVWVNTVPPSPLPVRCVFPTSAECRHSRYALAQCDPCSEPHAWFEHTSSLLCPSNLFCVLCFRGCIPLTSSTGTLPAQLATWHPCFLFFRVCGAPQARFAWGPWNGQRMHWVGTAQTPQVGKSKLYKLYNEATSHGSHPK